MCPSLPPPLQRRSSLRTLLFSTGKSAYFSSSEPKRQIFVPYLSTSQSTYHRSYLGACYASQIPHTPVTYHGLSSPRNYSTTDLSYVPSQVRQLAFQHSHHIGSTPGSPTSRLYRVSHLGTFVPTHVGDSACTPPGVTPSFRTSDDQFTKHKCFVYGLFNHMRISPWQ